MLKNQIEPPPLDALNRYEAWLLGIIEDERNRLRQEGVNLSRYNWLRRNPAWETDRAFAAMTPEEFDQAVDRHMATPERTHDD